LQCVADGDRLATVTGDPPPQERGISVSDIYVKAEGTRLDRLVAALADGTLSLEVTATLPFANAAAALQTVTAGRSRGAIVLTPDSAEDLTTMHT
jgi:NADPH:quinone reductase-like Zn-dependent oxidoreductase